MHFTIFKFLLALSSVVLLVNAHATASDGKKVNVYTVATTKQDGLDRLQRSAKLFGYKLKVLGMGTEWRGGDVARTTGGAQKINLLAEELKTLCGENAPKDAGNDLFLFTDAYDTVLVAPPVDVVEAFEKLDAKIVISAETYLWPDRSLASEYPVVGPNEYQFLCSGGFVGYTKSICEMILPRSPVADDDDDQLFYTKLFLDAALREKLGIKLDTSAEIFQNMHGALGDVSVKYMGSHSYAYNLKTESMPKVLHGNGPIKSEFNRFTDYIPDGWSANGGCAQCEEDTISLAKTKPEEMPIVVLGIFVEVPTPFLLYMLERVTNMNYPKNRMVLFVHNNVEYHENNITDFLMHAKTEEYMKFKIVPFEKTVPETEARNMVIDLCDAMKCEYAFMVDSLAHIDNPDTLKILIEQNRPTIAPFLKRPDELWSNFWGAISANGYYTRSDDYMEIVKGTKKGLWNVPFIVNAILYKADRLKMLRDAWSSKNFDPDLAVCAFMREKGLFMYSTNMHHFGHLVNPDIFDTSPTHVHPELWEIKSNRLDWERMYMVPEYFKVGEKNQEGISEPPSNYELCPDVYAFPFVTVDFCNHLVDEMEHFGQWSGGGHEDNRLSGGYENVPTVDIHMNQINYHNEWLHLLKTYVAPLASFAYTGFHPESKSSMMFVVRYHPREQDHLRPHFDSSTFSLNIALRRIGIDFEGGGTRFVRYNCSILSQKQGNLLMHPGRLTHWHEGLRITKGVRYIAVTFVDP